MMFKSMFARGGSVTGGKKIIFLFLIIFCLSGCNFKFESENVVQKELNIYNWEDYFGETTIDDFEKRFGIKVNLYTFEDEDLMLSDVQNNSDKYDLIVVSDNLVNKMLRLKLLQKINKDNIPNLKNIDNKFLNQWYDPVNDYSVPYLWGTTGIIFNTKYVQEPVKSWSVLFDEKYKGKIAMLNNSEEVIGAALKYLKYPLLAENIEQLNQVKKELLKQRDVVAGYDDPIKVRSMMIDEDIWIAQLYSGEASYAIDKNENLKYVIPNEGAAIWIDNFAVPVDAKNKEEAEKFIDFILEAKVGADISNYLLYANTNNAAREFTDPAILEDDSLYPNDEVLQKLEIFKTNKLNNEYNKIWAELQLK